MVLKVAFNSRMFRSLFTVRAGFCTRISTPEVPSPKGLPIFGTSVSLIVNSRGGQKLHEYVDARHKQLGPVFRERLGPITSVFICDAEHIRKVFANEGRYPRHVLPDCWLLYNDTRNYKRGLYFMDGKEWFEYRRVLNRILLKEDFFAKMSIEKENFLQRYFDSWLGDSRSGRVTDLEERLYELSIMCSILLDAASSCEGDGILREMLDQGIPTEMVRCIVVDFIIAAGDTTATATQWSLYLLGRHQHFQHQCFSQLMNNESIENVSLLRNLLKESMRLYPIAPFITRYLPHELQISSYTISAGELVSMSMYTCGRNEKYFPEANAFKPDRWERSSKTGKYVGVFDPNATLPYALGSRSCIGQKMAHAQILVTLAKLIRTYELSVTKTVDAKLNLITVPSEPIELYLRKRL